MIKKPDNMLCGCACIYYILNHIHNYNLNIPNNLLWITDIALFFCKNTCYDISLTCYNSSLYTDFLTLTSPYEFDGFISIDTYLNQGHKISEKQVTIQNLDKSIDEGNSIILNVSSAILNQDTSMNGGHYICIIGKQDNDFIIANPKKSVISIDTIDKKVIVNSSNCFGNWMLTVKDGML